MPCTLTIELKKENATITGTIPATTETVIVDGITTIITTPEVITYDWIPALKAAATEIQALNTLAAEGTAFPRPIECNPDAMIFVPEQVSAIEGGSATPAHWEGIVEGFIGAVNTPPTVDGMVTVRTLAYEWINVALLPAMPTTFNFILGTPKHAGMIA